MIKKDSLIACVVHKRLILSQSQELIVGVEDCPLNLGPMSKMVVNKNITPPVRSRFLTTTRKQVNDNNNDDEDGQL